eukprot:4269338-Karenia_brevis.AAC.1
MLGDGLISQIPQPAAPPLVCGLSDESQAIINGLSLFATYNCSRHRFKLGCSVVQLRDKSA